MPDPQVRLSRAKSRRRTAVVVLATTTVAFLASCGTSGSSDGAASSTTASTTKPATTTTKVAPRPAGKVDCPSVDAVAAVVGGPVNKSMTAGGGMSASASIGMGSETGDETAIDGVVFGYEGCSYDLAEGGQGEVSITRVTSEDLDGPALYKAMENGARDDAESNGFGPLDGLGDGAYRDGNDVVVRAENAMLFVSVTDANHDGSSEDATILAKSMLPLGLKGDGESIDCDAVSASTPAALGPVEGTSTRGGGVGIGDLSIDTEGCQISFADGVDGTVMVADPGMWDAWVTAKGESSFTASFVQVALRERSGFDDGEVLLIDDGKAPLRITASGDDLDPGTAELRLDLAELVLAGK